MGEALQLEKVTIKNVIGPTAGGTAILLGNKRKTFVMFVGLYEGAAILRELNHEEPPRPLTHELVQYIFTGFDVVVKQVIISEIVNNTFCATLILEQKVTDEKGEWVGKRNEVRIDARPSDCIILALKSKVDIWVSTKVLDAVRDVSEEMGSLAKLQGQQEEKAAFLKEFEFDPDNVPDFDLGGEGEGEGESESEGEEPGGEGEEGPGGRRR